MHELYILLKPFWNMKPACTIFLAIVFFCIPCKSVAQDKESVEIYWTEDNLIKVFAKNTNFYPVTAEVNFDLTNLKSTKKLPIVINIPALSEVLITNLQKKSVNYSWGFETKMKFYMGDIHARHDDNFAYRLPYKMGTEHRLAQGFDGEYSHKGDERYALDFDLPTGTEVYAARDGIVVDLQKKHNRGGAFEFYLPFANYVTIMHSDGTFADYTHLRKNGVTVQIGDEVRMGQHIGYSGATGFASGPHLHFAVRKAVRGGRYITLPVKFRTRGGIVELQEGELYTSY